MEHPHRTARKACRSDSLNISSRRTKRAGEALKLNLFLRLFDRVPGKYQMKHSVMLTISSLLLVLFLTFHLADDIVYGFEPGGLANLIVVVPFSVVWLYGTLVLA